MSATCHKLLAFPPILQAARIFLMNPSVGHAASSSNCNLISSIPLVHFVEKSNLPDRHVRPVPTAVHVLSQASDRGRVRPVFSGILDDCPLMEDNLPPARGALPDRRTPG